MLVIFKCWRDTFIFQGFNLFTIRPKRPLAVYFDVLKVGCEGEPIRLIIFIAVNIHWKRLQFLFLDVFTLNY